MKKHKFSLLLFALLAFGQTAWAQEWPKNYDCGNTTCTLTEEGVFTVSPKSNTDGAMANYSDPDHRPWVDEKTHVTTINVEPGVTVIGEYCFHNFTNLTSVTLPVGLREIHTWGFSSCENLQSINIPLTVTQIEGLAFGFCANLLNVNCYPYPDNLTWPIAGDDFGYGDNPSTTQIHVYDTYLAAYQSKFNNVSNIAFVGDLTTSGNWIDAGNYSASFREENNTIYIDSEADLARVAYCVNTGVTEYLNMTFSLTRDLDMTAHYWTAIGTQNKPFRGNFEGNGHTISGITFDPNNTSNYAGLFGYVKGTILYIGYQNPENAGCGFIQNLIVTRANVKGGKFVGGVIGSCYGESTILNIICQANVTGTQSVGGLIGKAEGHRESDPFGTITSYTTIKNCLLTGGVITGQQNYAALIGDIWNYTLREKNFYINPESNTNNSFDVRAYPVTKSDIPENVTVTINTDPGLTYQGTFYAPAGTVNFSVQNGNPINHRASVKVNGNVLGTIWGGNTADYSLNIVPETETYDITVTVEILPFIFTTDGLWNDVNNWSPSALPSSNDNVIINANATIPSGFVAQAGTIEMGTSGNLILNDGAQLIHGNGGITATVKKEITAYTPNTKNGWYLVSSPATEGFAPSADNGFLANEYDLYFYEESTHHWRNHKSNDQYATFNIEPLKGYLYANSANDTLSLMGTLRTATETVSVPLSYTDGIALAGFNLVGNPFAHNVTSFTGSNVATEVYRMNETKDDLTVANITATDPLKPGEGFFVKAMGDDASITFNSRANNAERSNITLEVSENSLIIDRFILKRDGAPLEKITLNENKTKVYATKEARDWAVVTMESNEQPLNFKAEKNGTYTLSVNVENMDLDYLHLIDNLTGADVDLLQMPEYTFTAKTTDYASRFRLVFSICGGRK